VNASEVAVELSEPGCSDLSAPTLVPSVHRAADESGPHSVKVTVPVGAPAPGTPATVAVSVTEPPMTMEPSPVDEPDCWVVVEDGAGFTVTGSVPQLLSAVTLLASPE
jgi:hypothetical protein